MTIRQISDGDPDGNSFGQSATDKISFFGKTPVVQPTAVTSATTTGTSAATAVNAVISRLRALGLIAT